eukprot:4261281-Prymnesium_polylepis.1
MSDCLPQLAWTSCCWARVNVVVDVGEAQRVDALSQARRQLGIKPVYRDGGGRTASRSGLPSSNAVGAAAM